jgi:hypothetical protein
LTDEQTWQLVSYLRSLSAVASPALEAARIERRTAIALTRGTMTRHARLIEQTPPCGNGLHVSGQRVSCRIGLLLGAQDADGDPGGQRHTERKRLHRLISICRFC